MKFVMSRDGSVMDSAPQISVVDDDEGIRLALDGLLRSAGHSARTFASAEEALADPHIEDSNCVITDLQMGRIDGLEFARRLRGRSQAMPILLMTAYPTANIERRARETDILFLSKPFEATEMLHVVHQMLQTGGR